MLDEVLIGPRKGLNVIATARNRTSIKDLESMGISTISLDVTNSENIAAARMEVEKLTGGALDILINNAYATPFFQVHYTPRNTR